MEGTRWPIPNRFQMPLPWFQTLGLRPLQVANTMPERFCLQGFEALPYPYPPHAPSTSPRLTSGPSPVLMGQGPRACALMRTRAFQLPEPHPGPVVPSLPMHQAMANNMAIY